jgi:hypothetical protein
MRSRQRGGIGRQTRNRVSQGVTDGSSSSNALTAYAVVLLFLGTICAAEAEPRRDPGPTHAQLTAIADWVATTLNLPLAEDMPRVELVSQDELTRLRYRGFMAGPARTVAGEDRSQAIGGEHSTPLPRFQREVVATYDNVTATIYLPSDWNDASQAQQSLLVHEMVHHLQNRAQLKFECAGERERPAYLAQKQWLEQHGLDLKQEFQVDMFTIVALSVCME